MSLFEVLFGWIRRPVATDIGDDVEVVELGKDDPTFNTGGSVSVILTGLYGDDGIRAAKIINRLLSGISMLGVRRSSQRIDVDFSAPHQMLDAIEHTRDALGIDGALVAVCGATISDGAAVGIWFVTEDPLNDVAVPGRFTADDILIAPAGFPVEVQNAIAASVVAAACAASPAAAQRLHQILKHYVDILTPLVEEGIEGIPANIQAGIMNAIGNVMATRARFTRSEALYDLALQAYSRAVLGYDAAFSPLSWASAKSHYAQVLVTMALIRGDQADGEDDEDLLPEAIVAYEDIRDTLSIETAPRPWAQAQIDFAMLTYRHAVNQGTRKPFRDALKALQSAQSVFSRQIYPVKWSEIMNHMGVILLTMGEDRGDDDILKHAIASFEQSMQVRRRETMPKLWAQTANNLGATSFSLAKRTRDKEALTGAARNFEGAKQVYEELGQSQRASVIEKNLSRVRRLMETSND